jgi:HD-GYP domain-containing protein (c-di-GMP phosphodiesterase class II)
MISTLRRLGVSAIYIDDPRFRDVEMQDLLQDETKRVIIQQMSETFEALKSGKDFSARAISKSIDQLLDDVMRNSNVMVHLSDIRTTDNAMFVHAMNVCMLSALIGLNMGLNMLQLKDLSIGALLHDIGKIDAPEVQEGRTHHAWRGFDILKSKREYNLLIAHVAFQHHEATDGSGVPRGISGDEIHLYAKIVAAANTYDNLLCTVENGKTLLPHEACERLNAMSGTKLDYEVLTHFMRFVSVYPNGISVRLSNHKVGVVVGQHRGLPGRPVVRIISKEDGEAVEAEEIDLAEHPTIFIESVLS